VLVSATAKIDTRDAPIRPAGTARALSPSGGGEPRGHIGELAVRASLKRCRRSRPCGWWRDDVGGPSPAIRMIQLAEVGLGHHDHVPLECPFSPISSLGSKLAFHDALGDEAPTSTRASSSVRAGHDRPSRLQLVGEMPRIGSAAEGHTSGVRHLDPQTARRRPPQTGHSRPTGLPAALLQRALEVAVRPLCDVTDNLCVMGTVEAIYQSARFGCSVRVDEVMGDFYDAQYGPGWYHGMHDWQLPMPSNRKEALGHEWPVLEEG
jgi:hypothetical protein